MYIQNGKVFYTSYGELLYNLFSEIGLGINKEGYVYDQDTNIVLKINDKYIKATFADGVVLYAGKNDIIFDPSRNYKLMVFILGYFLDKEKDGEDGDTIGFISQGLNEDRETYTQQLFVDTRFRGRVVSEFYHNGYLCYIDIILKLSGVNVDLHNFDIVNEAKR